MPFTGVKRFNNRVLLVGIEVASGTAETLDADDVVYVDEASLVAQPNTIQRRELGVGIDMGRSVITTVPAQLSATAALRGSGVAGTPPNFGRLLIASGMSETPVATTSVTYAPVSEDIETLTANLFEDGVLKVAEGMAVGWTMTIATGAVCTLAFTGLGTFPATDPKTDVANPTIVAPTIQPIVWRGDIGGVFTIDTDPVIVSNLTFDAGISPAAIEDANASGGIFGHLIPSRNITGNMNPASTAVATRNLFASLLAGTVHTIQAVLGSTAGNILTINADIAILNESPTDDNGVQRDDVPFEVIADTFEMIWT